MENNKQRYMMRGVSASKEDVHNAIKNIDKGVFPRAFCKIIPDIFCKALPTLFAKSCTLSELHIYRPPFLLL